MRLLLTNDDGIEAEGIQALREALSGIGSVELEVIAPDGNRSGTARGITTRDPISVEEVLFSDGRKGYSTDGTPVDCVRFAALGLIDEFRPDLIVAGINHGANLGDDVTYSGTVAAAFEGVLLGLPAIAVSQAIPGDWAAVQRAGRREFLFAAAFAAKLVEHIMESPVPSGTLLNVNCPPVSSGSTPDVSVTRLGKRIYRDQLSLHEHEPSGRRTFKMYGEPPDHDAESGTDISAVAEGRISVTPVHYDLTDRSGVTVIEGWGLSSLAQEGAGAG